MKKEDLEKIKKKLKEDKLEDVKSEAAKVKEKGGGFLSNLLGKVTSDLKDKDRTRNT